MDLRWQPRPDRSPDPWPPNNWPPATGPSMPGWLEERLFDQRIVMIRGQLSAQDATGVAAALLTLDAAGPAPVQLHVASPAGELAAAHAIIDVIDAMTAPVHAVVTSEAGGAGLAGPAPAEQPAADRHAPLQLPHPPPARGAGPAGGGA